MHLDNLYMEDLYHRIHHLIQKYLWVKIIIGMVLGIVLGIVISPSTGLFAEPVSMVLAAWFAIPGRIFLALIQMMVLPLVVSSIILGILSGENVSNLQKAGSFVLPFFIVTTAVAVIIGISITYAFKPGQYVSFNKSQIIEKTETPPVIKTNNEKDFIEIIPDTIVELIPKNPLSVMINRSMLHVVIYAFLIGIALLVMPSQKAKPLINWFNSLQEVSLTIIGWAMHLAPIAVFGLMTQVTIETGIDGLIGMSAYVGTVLSGIVMLMVLYACVVWIGAGLHPWRFFSSIRNALLLAFSTSSSAVVMPLSMKSAEENLGVRKSISKFVIPQGATINMGGTALYQGAAAIFLIQVFNIEINIPDIAFLIITVVGASVGSPASPGVGIVILASILSGIGVPPQGIALIISVDRILDMARTAANVEGDLAACVLMEQRYRRTVESSTLEVNTSASLSKAP